MHAFEVDCAELDVEYRLIKPRHRWSDGQVERMNWTMKEATVKRYYYEGRDQIRRYLIDFIAAYNFGRRLKTLKGLTPYQANCKASPRKPHHSTSDPTHHITGPNIQRSVSRRIRRRLIHVAGFPR